MIRQQQDDLLEQALGELLRLQQMEKVQDRRLVRHVTLAPAQARNAAQLEDILQRLLHSGI